MFRTIEKRIFISRVDLLRVSGELLSTTTSATIDESHFFIFRPIAWRQPHSTHIYYLFFIHLNFHEELEVKYDSCNSKMENNCFSDNFIGYVGTYLKCFCLYTHTRNGIQIDKSNSRAANREKKHSKTNARKASVL